MEASERIEVNQQDAEPRSDFGAKLKAAREAQDLTIEHVAAELRIRPDALTALEESRFDALGPPVFAKGYLKQYGARLGLDVAALAAGFDQAVGASGVQIAPSRTIRLRDERQITIWAIAALALALVVVLLSVWWFRPWAPSAGSITADGGPAAVPPAEVARPESVIEPEPEPLAEAANEPAADAAVEPGPGAAAEPEAGLAIEPESEPDLAIEPEPAPEPGIELPAAAATAADAAPDSPVAPPIEGPVLEVVFVEDSWTEITAADGERLYYALGRAGTRQRFPADPGLNLLFGNAAGIELSIDGRAVPIPGAGGSGDVARFDLGVLID